MRDKSPDAFERTLFGALVLIAIFLYGLLAYEFSQASMAELVEFATLFSAVFTALILVSYIIGTLISEVLE